MVENSREGDSEILKDLRVSEEREKVKQKEIDELTKERDDLQEELDDVNDETEYLKEDIQKG